MGAGGASLCKGALAVLLIGLAAIAGGCGSEEGDTEQVEQAASDRKARAALAEYRSYLEENASSLVEWTDKLWGQTVDERLPQAQSRYATARVQYGQLLPLPHFFPALDRRINAQRQESKGRFIGFHRIELSLFGREDIANLKGLAGRLVKDLRRLEGEVKTARLDPVVLAEATTALLDEVVEKKLTGREEPYSEIDLVDVSASVEGAEAVFEAVRPPLEEGDPRLVRQIEARFEDTYALLMELGVPARAATSRRLAGGSSFVQFGELEPGPIKDLQAAVRRLEGSFARVPAQLPSTRSGS
jgi:iron uptake system EfeUOB component EfeO/EfeM